MKAIIGIANKVELEGTPEEITNTIILLDKEIKHQTEEYSIHEQELKQDNTLQLEKAIQLIREPRATIATPFNVQITEPKKQRNKWKGKVWSNYVPEFLGKNPQFRQVSKRGQKGLISNFLKSKLGISEVKPVLIRKFRNTIYWQSTKGKYEIIGKELRPTKEYQKKSNSINWNKIALTWASLTPKPKLGIFLRKSLGYIANSRQQKRFQQELDSLMLTKKIPIKQNTPLNYSVIGLKPKLLKLRNKSFQNAKPKQHRIKRNWIQLATKYLDQKFVNPNLTISKFCEQEFGNSSGTRYQKLSQTLQQITTFKKRITEPLPKPVLEELSKIEPQPEQRIQNEVGTPI